MLRPATLSLCLTLLLSHAAGAADGPPFRIELDGEHRFFSQRFAHTATWTGREVLFFGGRLGFVHATPELGAVWNGKAHTYLGGMAFDPAQGRWRRPSRTNAPEKRAWHSVVFTGSEVIVWGGQDAGPEMQSGAAWNPVTDRWTPTSRRNAPAARVEHSAVWSGAEMLVWGGVTEEHAFSDGGAYDPKRRRWRSIPSTGAPRGRRAHAAVWTGTEMIVWGGINGSQSLDTGGRYDPTTDRWRPLPREGAPPAGGYPAIGWTGVHVLVWSGRGGARFDPRTGTWSPMATKGAPSERRRFASVWTGRYLVVWGGAGPGSGSDRDLSDGACYDPATDTWRPLPADPSCPGRTRPCLAATDRGVLLLGGAVETHDRTVTVGGLWNLGSCAEPVVTGR